MIIIVLNEHLNLSLFSCQDLLKNGWRIDNSDGIGIQLKTVPDLRCPVGVYRKKGSLPYGVD